MLGHSFRKTTSGKKRGEKDVVQSVNWSWTLIFNFSLQENTRMFNLHRPHLVWSRQLIWKESVLFQFASLLGAPRCSSNLKIQGTPGSDWHSAAWARNETSNRRPRWFQGPSRRPGYASHDGKPTHPEARGCCRNSLLLTLPMFASQIWKAGVSKHLLRSEHAFAINCSNAWKLVAAWDSQCALV